MLFAIGDIHGCAAELRLLVNKLPLTADSTLVLLGDYVDRGPDSRGVIDTVLELKSRCNVIALAGNHEAMFSDYLEAPESARAASFIFNGGSATLASYADDANLVTIPGRHREFIASLPVFHQTEQYFFVHAGLPPVPLAEIDPERDRKTLLWIRNKFLKTSFDWGKVVVHGHTPVDKVTRLPNRINLDTGCVFNRRLSAIALPGEQQYSVRRLAAPRQIVLRDPSGTRAAYRFQGEVPVRVMHDGRALHFVTVDYSELGMYLRAETSAESVRFEEGDKISGVVGSDESSLVAFDGHIVRRRSDDRGLHYGVRITATRSVAGDSAGLLAPLDPATP